MAREVEKHHAAFTLVGSEVSRVHATVEHEKMEPKAVKGAVEQIVQTLEQWDQHDPTIAPPRASYGQVSGELRTNLRR